MNFKNVPSLRWNQLRRIVVVKSFCVFTFLGMAQNSLANENNLVTVKADANFKKITLKIENQTLKDVFKKIENQLNVHIMYESSQVNSNKKISLRATNQSLVEIMDKICGSQSLKYQIIDRNIIIKKSTAALNLNINTQSNYTISGVVVGSDDNLPLPGVNIQIKGSKQGWDTDFDGRFKIALNNQNVVLVFSYLGYVSQEIAVSEITSDLKIKLVPVAKQLQEVVVMGYGSVKKSEVVGAVSTVSMKEASSRTYNSTAELLQGTVAGVTVVNNGGDPTAPPKIIIRGVGSTNAEEPMIVLDGIIFNGSFNDVNPNDIESISVLKDAASAAIYGARASGGVILITTKKGKAGKVNIKINYQGGSQQVAKKLEALNAAEYADAMNTATDNAKLPRIAAFDVTKEPTARTTNTVWSDEIFRSGKIQDLSMSVDGGNETANFFISGGYRKNEGVLLNTYSDRYTARANSSFKINSKLRIGENITYSLTNGQSGNTNDSYIGAILAAIFYPPNATIYKQDGSGDFGGVPSKYIGSYGDVINPVAYLSRLDVNNPTSTILINPYADWEIVKGLNFKTNWGYTRIQNNRKQFTTKVPEPGKIFDFNELAQSTTTATSLLSEQTLTFSKKIANHNFTALAGYTFQKDIRENHTIKGTGFDSEDPSLRYLSNAKTFKTSSSYSQEILLSYIGRVNYSYKDKYLVSAVVRRDGTSKFIADKRWKVYPSLSLGWLISEENFMKNIPSFVSVLKLRASNGTIGNLGGSLGSYQFSIPLNQTSSLFGNPAAIQFGLAENELSNKNLTWESSEQKNIGLDFGFLNNSITGSVDAFVKTNKDMLFQNGLPGLSGTPNGQTINAGNVENKGLEINLGYKKSIGDFSFDASANVSFVSNKMTALTDGVTTLEPKNIGIVRQLPLANIYQVGSPVNAFYGYSTAGLFQSDAEAKAYVNSKGVPYQPNAVAGDIKFVNNNGDDVIDNNDRVVLGNPFPKTSYSFNLNMNYKRFDMNVFLQGVAGNSNFNAVKYTGLNASFPGYNLLAESKNAWSPQNTNTSIPVLSAKDNNNNFGRISDFYIEDASFLRLKNITIGYTPNESIFFNKVKARFYISAQNLITFTKYSGMDPEVGLSNYGLDLGKYPLSKIYMMGVNLNF